MEKKELIEERMNWLLKLAEKNIKDHPERTKRYVEIAKKLSTRYKVKLPEKFKKRICKICNIMWIPGYNVKVRLNKRTKAVEYLCECGHVRRFGYSKKRD